MSLRVKKFLIIFAGVTLLMNGAMASSVAYANNKDTQSAAKQTTNPQNTTNNKDTQSAAKQTTNPQNTTNLEARPWAENDGKTALDLIDCGGKWDGLTPSCIVPIVTYYAIYIPASGILYLSGLIFDFMLSLSIDKKFIDQPFVNQLWEIVRDFSNMIFIFILLYTGIQTMFGLGGAWQKKIVTIVILALIINFSMFFPKIIIDAGNTLAVGIYEATGSPKNPRTDSPHLRTGQTVDERNISASLMNAFSPGSFTNLASTNKSYAAMVFLIAAIVSGYAAFIFLKAALLFLGRVIAFWFYMIISPFALISMVLPKGNIFDTWLYGLINQAMVAPIFLFLVYLVMFAVNGGEKGAGILASFGTPTSSSDMWGTIFLSVVITGMVIYALQYALKVATGMAGDFGKIGAQAATAVLTSFPAGMGAKLALGGTAMALRATVGQGASKMLDSGALRKMSTAGGLTGVLGRGLTRTAERAEKGSFDILTTGVLQKGAKSLGVGVDFGKAGGKGGWEAEQKKRKKEDDRRAGRAELTDDEKKKMAPDYETAKKTKESSGEMKKSAEKAHKEAKASSDSSATGQRVSSAEKSHQEKQMSAAKMSGDTLVKRVEALNKKQAEAITDKQKAEINREIEEVQKLATRAELELKEAETELNAAKAAHAATDAGKAFADATSELNRITAATEAAEKIVKDSEKMFKDENERRREAIGRAQTFTRLYFTKAAREKNINKIRAGKSPEEKEEEKSIKLFKKAVEKVQKEEEEEEKPKDGGGDEKK